MRISKKLLPGTTFCGVEISRKLGRRAYSPRWCDSPDATQQKLDAESHLARLREAFVASVEEEAAASASAGTTTADDAVTSLVGTKSAGEAAPTKSAGKARQSSPVQLDEPEGEEEMKEAEDLYSRVSNVTMESSTSSPHSESQCDSPAYFSQPPPHHERFNQQLQSPYYMQPPQPYYVLQQQQQRQALPHPSPVDGRKRSRDDFTAAEQAPRGFHHLPSHSHQQSAPASSFGSRPNFASAEEARVRNFGSPLPNQQRFHHSPAAPQYHHQPQRPAAAHSDHDYRQQSDFASSFYSDHGNASIGGGRSSSQRPVPSSFQPLNSKTERSFGANSGGNAKGALPKQLETERPVSVPFHTYMFQGGYEPSYYGAEEDTIMGGNANLPRMFGNDQPHQQASGAARSTSSSGISFDGVAILKNPSPPPALPKLPSLRASLQRATYQQEQELQQQQHQNQQHRM